MSLILRQVIGYQQGKKSAPTTAPELTQQLHETKQQLQAILNKWKFNNRHPSTSQEFLTQFAPWIDEQIESKKSLKLFLAKKGVNNLAEAETKLINQELAETSSELDQFLSDNRAENLEQIGQQLMTYETKIQELKDQVKNLSEENLDPLGLNNLALEQARRELAELKETWQNTEEDYLQQIQALREDLQGKDGEIERLKEENSTRTTFTYDEDTEDETPFPSRQKLQHDLDQAQAEIARLKDSQGDSEELAELETERDQLARDKLTLEQETLALNNRLNLKQQEVSRKEDEITRLKKEKADKETSLNKRISDLKKANGATTNMLLETRKTQEEWKQKYSQRTKELDEEQCENNKLTEKIATLEAQIAELKK